ncbi:uncharacterized protein LOC101172694 isoform X2 [Oryzias latipes]|uniref:uncharacterized protein LOC101172694 isoform X2 n=1 Tax=Oryzias latipes TaxID=8090 RepID=UPI0005CC7A4B|nr:uncharacterized protein LOC101172694 isoform X2 [Oryzias latipes]
MSGDCTHMNAHFPAAEVFSLSKAGPDGDSVVMEPVGSSSGLGSPARLSANFEVIDGVLYRKKLEKGFINYREVLGDDRRHEAISTFHQRRPGQRHLSLEETYKCVADNYWWEGMYFQIRDFVLCCPRCQSQHRKKLEQLKGRRCVTKMIASHGTDVLSKLRSQREAGLFCDITLRTNGRSFSAHRAVLAAVSDHFQEIFTEMDSSNKADIDLTGFNEDGLLSLLDFSYSSTLSVRQEDLPEVCAMARHLGMWPAVEACCALLKEQERQLHPGKAFISALGLDNMNDSLRLTLDESLHESPKRSLRRMPKTDGHNGFPQSPVHRMKLMDFKSPSSKKAAIPRHASSQSHSYSPISPSNTRLLRSSPGASKQVQKLFPVPETPRKKRKPHSITQLSRTSRLRPNTACSPVRVKQEGEEVGEDEEDYARAQEKYKLMNVLGLQRTALLPRPEDLIGWRQKKRLRKLKANNYSLTKRRKPRLSSPVLSYSDIPLSIPLCNPVNTRLLKKSVKSKPVGSVEQIAAKRRKSVQPRVPPSDRSMRSKGVLPDLFQRPSFGGRELRQSVRKGDGGRSRAQQPLRRKAKQPPVRNTIRIKTEPAECSVSSLRPSPQHHGGYTPLRSSPKTRAKTAAARETVKTLRYNSSRMVTKSRRGSAKDTGKMKVKSREKAGIQSPKGTVGVETKIKDAEVNGLQFSEHLPQPSFYSHPMYKAIKEEPAEPVPVAGPFPDPPSPDLGKRQSKPPIKLLDSGFLFSFCRPTGGPMSALKKEEESVDICLTRSVSQVGEKFKAEESPYRNLRARRRPVLPVVKREREERTLTQSQARRHASKSPKTTLNLAHCSRSQAARTMTKPSRLTDVGGRSCSVLDSVRRARLKQLRGPRSQAPKAPKTAHACLQCSADYKDCVALIMHRLRHIEGKHWPCPLCSKTFFRLRNVRNHIRTHKPKLYKCRSCIAAGS